jgi:putative endonuclease
MRPADEQRRKALGHRGERVAALLLRLRGLRILDRNVRVPGACEVDLVARDGRVLVLVEVKARRSLDAAEPVVAARRAALRRGGEALMAAPWAAWAQTVRFDVVAVEGYRVRYLRGAF